MSCPLILNYLNSVTSIANLPTSGNSLGDVRTVRDNAAQYYWSNSSSTGVLSDWIPVNSLDLVSSSFSEFSKSDLGHKSFSYSGDNLITIEIFSDFDLLNLIYTKDLNYTGDKLTSIVLTREEDAQIFTKTISYTGDNIISIKYS
jgi:ABC-type antimicrobial peptide transport system permease subunit